MAEPNPTESRFSICLLTLDTVAGKALVNTVCGMGGGPETELDGIPVHLDLHHYEAEREAELVAAVNAADAVALMVHHVDAPSLERLKQAFRILPSVHKVPVALLMVREASKMEFKMVCPNCSQKLWVRDEDQGRIGRCPHCKNTFVLPAQGAFIKRQLTLPASFPVTMVIIGNPGACRGPLTNLAAQAKLRAQVMKSSTMPLSINPVQAQGG